MENENDRKERKKLAKAQKEQKFKNKAVFNKTAEKKRDIKEVIEVLSTPAGTKKDTSRELPKTYDPHYTEEGWFSWWEKQGFFRPEYNASRSEETFVIMIPPPNVTGVLHIGHALTLSIEDCIVRWNRMLGKQTLWLPGTDHAGIATQAVVEKKLMRERNLNRHDLGRDKFIEEVWKWKEEKGDRIIEQLKKMGSSCDFSRLRFTMDESMSAAVKEAFVRLFEAGSIYRAKRLVHWSCALRSAISEIEVEKRELKGRTELNVPGYDKPVEFGCMAKFVYVVEGTEERLEVATTRIETMLGDTAVAVHPTDARYLHIHDKKVQHPFRNGELLPIIVDTSVDPEFGTGVVKITPAHDATDFAIGQRHGLAMPTIFTDDGLICPGYGEFSGMKRFEARKAVAARLESLGLFLGVEDHAMVLPICSKSKDVLEPMLKEQWYLKCAEAAKRALEAQQKGDLVLLPEGVHDGVWTHWLSDCHDWCISRQLWWGHRIPVYRTKDGQDWVAARSAEEAAKKLGGDKQLPVSEVVQDEDVLDTWFSSQLFPFATLGWPTETADLSKFYPGDLLETGHDIIFFWVARMVMIGLTMTGKLPFTTVYLHAMVRDAHGRKMSKSLGNVLDPLDMIAGVSLADLHRAVDEGNLDPRERERAKQSQSKDFPNGIPQCGTDALRFALLAYTAQPRDINLDVLRVSGYRNFCNKIWQAFRFATMFGLAAKKEPGDLLSATDRWILWRLSAAVTDVNSALSSYNFSAATTAVHRFWIYDLCDVYLEYCKPFRGGSRAPLLQSVLHRCLDTGLRLLHPMMPYLTEELYQRLPGIHGDSICVAPFPLATDFADVGEGEGRMPLAVEMLRRVRVWRKDNVQEKETVHVVVKEIDQAFCRDYLDDVVLPLTKCVRAGPAAEAGDLILSHELFEVRRG